MKFLINGGRELHGKVEIEGAKNAVLPIMAGAILCDGEVKLKNAPHITDVWNMISILNHLGAKVSFDGGVAIDACGVASILIPTELSQKLRASILLLGALLGRFKHARITYPGGCDIGLRPIDLHLKAMRELGVVVKESHGVLNCDATNLHGGVVVLDYASVGTTENLILLCANGRESVTLVNVAREPEVVDLCNFLNRSGANIIGAGTSEIVIHPVGKLVGIEYEVIKDRIVAGTYLLAGAITGGEVEVCGVEPQYLTSLLKKLCQSGCFLYVNGDKIKLKSCKTLKSVGFMETNVYPAFPTDLQAQFLVLQAVSKGDCVVKENVFESRFRFVLELIKMGAKITVDGRMAFVEGGRLSGAEVWATDLRGGAALILAGLNASGYTKVYNAEYVLRGYENIDKKLLSLGAEIKLI